MRIKAGILLSHLGLVSLAAAQIPVFTAKDPGSYIQGSATSDVTGGDIAINTDDGLKITFGPDVSKRLRELRCSDASKDCIAKTAEAMGAGEASGLRKRMALGWTGLGGAFLSTIVEVLWTVGSGFKSIDDPANYHVVTINIPHDQTDEISKWEAGEGKFEFVPSDGESITVELDTDRPKPDNLPSIEKQENGDLKISLPDMKSEIEAQWDTVVCSREEQRSLQKRWVPRCLARLVEVILRDAQVDGNLAAIQYVKPGFFPKPKNQLLIETFGEVEEYSEKLVLFKGLAAESRGSMSEFVTWVTFAEHVGGITIDDDGTMVIPSKFLDEQPSESEDEDEKECWDEDSIQQPFCSNCGGDQLGKDSGNGECEGIEGAYKGQVCPCFVDDDDHFDGYSIEEIDENVAVIGMLMNDETDGDEEEEESVEQVCFKQDEGVRKDTSKWKWVGRDAAARLIEEFCSQNFEMDSTTTRYDDGDEGRDSIWITARYSGIDPPSRDTCIYNLRDQLLDGCDADETLNQFNLKWGGRRTLKHSGMEFELQPINEKVSTGDPNWECNTWQNREDKDSKGKDGKDLPEVIDDKMMKEMCVHELWFKGFSEFDCGGKYMIRMMHSNGYLSSNDCWNFNYACISNAIQNDEGVVMTGTHWAGSAGRVKNYWGIRCWIGFDDY